MARIELRIDEDEKDSWVSMAAASRLTLSQWIRMRCTVVDGLTGKPVVVSKPPRTDIQEVVYEPCI